MTRQIALLNAAHLLCHYCLLILPTAVLAMAVPGGAFGQDYGPVLTLATGMFVLYGALSLPQGWLAARFGRTRMMAAFFGGTGLSLLGCGAATSPTALALGLAATGGFAAIYHPVGMSMLIDAAGARPGRAIGTHGVSGNLGVALAPVLTALLAARLGWPAAFIAPGLACLAVGALWLREPAGDGGAAAAARPFPAIPPAVVRRAVAVQLLVAVVSGLVFNAFTLLLPKLLQERLAGDAGLIGLVGTAAFLVTLCGAATQFTVGRLIDRTTLRRAFLPMALVLAPSLALLAVLQGWAVLPVAGAAAAVIFGQITVNETMTARYVAPPLRARMYSVRFFVGFLGGALAAPLIGVLHQGTGGLSAALLVLAGFALVTLGCAALFPDRPEELAPELWARGAAAEARKAVTAQ